MKYNNQKSMKYGSATPRETDKEKTVVSTVENNKHLRWLEKCQNKHKKALMKEHPRAKG